MMILNEVVRGWSDRWSDRWSEKKEKTIDIILQLIKDNPSITRKVLVQTVGISPSAIQKHINRLKAAGVIIRHCVEIVAPVKAATKGDVLLWAI